MDFIDFKTLKSDKVNCRVQYNVTNSTIKYFFIPIDIVWKRFFLFHREQAYDAVHIFSFIGFSSSV